MEKKELLLVEELISNYVKKHAKEMPDKIALNFYGRQVTYKELDESSDRLATAIADMGCKKGDRIAEFMQTSPQIYITYLAAIKLGLISVPIDPMSKEFELEYALNDSGSTLVVTFDQLYPIVKNVKDKSKVKNVIVTSFHDYLPDEPELPLHTIMKTSKETFADTHKFLELIEKYQPNPPTTNVALSDNGWILYTGGTTGMPKGCLHTQYNCVLSALGQCEIGYRCSKDDILLTFFPHTHVSGISTAFNPTLVCGMMVIPLVRWDPITAMKAIEKYKVTLLFMTTPQYTDIINHPEAKKYNLTSLRQCQIAPFISPFTSDINENWQKITGCPVYQWGFGSSDLFNYAAYGIDLPFKEFAFGVAAPGVQIKIVDFEARKKLPAGKEGEIVVKSPAQLKEYWNKPDETKKDIVDGWLYTGDIGKLAKDKTLYFFGRKKEIIKVSGYTVAPKEIELIGLKHPAIDKIAVVGLPDAKKGEIPKAYVILKPNARESASEIEAWFKDNISAIKRPVVEIRTELPLSGKGEVLKRKLVEEELSKMAKKS